MTKYYVTLPITGEASLIVDADSPAAAIERGIEVFKPSDVDTWYACRKVCEGATNAYLNEAYASELFPVTDLTE